MMRLLACVLLLTAGAVQAAEPPFVRDEAGLFLSEAAIRARAVQAGTLLGLLAQAPQRAAPAACLLDMAECAITAPTDVIEQAEQQVVQLREHFHRDLVIVTLKELPAEERKGLRSLWRRELNRRLAEEARERAEAAGVEGVFIEIGTSPGHVVVVVWPSAQERIFTYTDAQHLQQFLIRRLGKAGNDKDKRAQVLLEAIGQVRLAFEKNRADIPTLPASEVFLGELFVSLIVAWVVLLGVRRRLTGKASDPRELAAAGWQTCLGTPAGAWVADRVFLSHRAPAPPAAAPTPAALPGPSPATVAAPPP